LRGRRGKKSVRLACVFTGVIVVLLLRGVVVAQEWDVNAVRSPGSVLEYEAMEGSWISVDVPPDGRQIVFDLLGHLYEMPVEVGRPWPEFDRPRYKKAA
jgi:hypothetical protein